MTCRVRCSRTSTSGSWPTLPTSFARRSKLRWRPQRRHNPGACLAVDGPDCVDVGHVDVVSVRRLLLDDVSFRVGEGAKVALVGANGAGKTTLLRLVAGDEVPQGGTIGRSGGLGVTRQFIGSVQDATTVRDLLLSVSPPGVRAAGAEVAAAELAMMETDDEPTQLPYAHALANSGDAGGY